MKYVLIWILAFACHSGFAQKRKDQRCPTTRKTPRGFTLPVDLYSFKADIGVRHPFTYRNPNSFIGENYRTVAKPNAYISIGFYHALSQPWGISVTALATQTRQGLYFDHYDNGEGISGSSYQSAFQLRFPVQFAYTRPGYQLRLGPSLIYNSFSMANQTTGSIKAGDADPFADYSIRWNAFASYTTWHWGFDAALEKKIVGNLSLNINAAIDFRQSAATEGQASIELTPGQTESHYAITKPYLWYAGIGLSYKVFRRAAE
ncbi:MAG: hypothetical protein EOP56_17945 [Sphingobacteriales bacterium]|nr:MAG: hypothetical protein EOP56_17945 [Sphingobacteriales bacterium]